MQRLHLLHPGFLPAWALPLLAGMLALLLPARLLFLVGIVLALGLGIAVAELRRQFGPGLPRPPWHPEG